MKELIGSLVKVMNFSYRNPKSYTKALSLYRKKDWGAAKSYFELALLEDSTHAPSFFKLGMCAFRQKKYQQALQYINHALVLDPRQKQWQEQLDQTTRHVIKSTNLSAAEREQFIRQQLNYLDNPSADLLNQMAHSLRKQGKWWQEIEVLNSAISVKADQPSWHYRLGEALEAMGRFSEAAAAYDKAIILKKEKIDGSWYYRKGYCYEQASLYKKNGNAALADKSYQMAVGLDKSLKAKRFGIGVYHQQRGLWKLAQKAYLNKLKNEVLDAELYYKLGMTHDRCYEWLDAENYYRKAISLDMRRPEWHYRLGFVLERQGKLLLASQSYCYAATNRAKHSPYWFYRWGYVLEQLKEYQKASEAYTEMNLLHSLYDRTNVSHEEDELGESFDRYINQFTRQEIIEIVEEELMLDSSDARKWQQLGSLYLQENEWEKSADAYRQAARRYNTHSPELYYSLGYVNTRLMDYQSACDAFRNTRILTMPHGVSEQPFNESEQYRLLATYAEYYERLLLKDKSILFESFNGSSLTCNPYALFLYMYGLPEYADWHFVWVLNDLEKIPEQLKKDKNISFVVKGGDAYLRALCECKYLVNNSGFPPYFIKKDKQKYLATWHGTPLKTLGKEQKYKFFDHKRTQRNFLQASHIISPNPHATKIQLGSYDIERVYTGLIAETGYPRIDLTLNITESEKEKIKLELGLIDNKPVVLYAPTWRGTLQDVEFDTTQLTKDIDELTKRDCQVIFRGHSLLEDKLEEVSLDCTIVPEWIDTNSLLGVVDILITDYSSVFFDFIPLNKPILLYAYDYEEYEKERGLYFKLEEMPGSVSYTLDSLLFQLDDILRTGDFSLKGYQEAVNKFNLHDDGKASEKVANFFLNDDLSWDVRPNKRMHNNNVLFFPGGLEPNGITTSFVNLMGSLDKDKINPVVAFSPNGIETNPNNREQFSRLNYGMDFIPRYGSVVMTLEERYVRMRADKRKYEDLSVEEDLILSNIYSREFKRIFGNSKFQSVVHFSGYDEFWMKVLSSCPHARKVTYLHNDLYSEWLYKFPYLATVFNLYSKYDKLVSVSKITSEVNKKNLSYRFSLNEEKFVHSENLQNPDEVLSQAEAEIGKEDSVYFSGNDVVFITVGRLSIEKDHEKLILAFSQLLSVEANAKLLILGDGPLKADLQSLVRKLSLQDKVHLLGRRLNPFPLIKKSDCFVLSSNHEGQPMVLFEALILKKPIIATDIPGNRSVLQLADQLCDNDANALAKAMEDFINGRRAAIDIEFNIANYQKAALEKFYSILRVM